MAKMLIDVTVKMGRVIPVENQNKKWNECPIYNSIKIEEEDGWGERYVLFTTNELNRLPIVDANQLPQYSIKKNKDQMKSGRLYPCFQIFKNGKRRACLLLKTEIYSQSRKEWFVVIKKVAPNKLVIADERADRNYEDCAVTSFWQDLLD